LRDVISYLIKILRLGTGDSPAILAIQEVEIRGVAV
jgi:hypothetical protein